MSAELDKTTSQILGPDGSVATMPTLILSEDEARILRQYKKFLQKRGLRESLYCNDCWNGERHDGCKAYVTDNQILIQCRCKLRFYQGVTY